MKIILKGYSISNMLLFCLVATLPFYNITFLDFELTLTVILFASIILVSSLDVVVRGGVNKPLSFAVLHFCFLMLAAISTVWIVQDTANNALLKSVFYSVAFLAMIRGASRDSRFKTLSIVLRGASVGVIFYFIISGLALIYTGNVFSIFSSFSVNGFSVELYRSVDLLFGGDGVFHRSELRRNAMAEIFAFTCLVPLVFSEYIKPSKLDFFASGLSFFALLATFSRRGLITVVLVVLIVLTLRDGKKLVTAAVGVVLGVILYITFTVLESQNRFVFGGELSRINQYKEAYSGFMDNIVFGLGYAAKVDNSSPFGGVYTHNYWIGNAYMLGVIGLALSLAITVVIIKSLVVPFQKRRELYCLLLVIPLIGMAVGATVEGIYTPIGWIVFFLCFAYDRELKSRNTFR